ncbi:hypothetical protein E2C01_101345 [Portunus trituberculatus]|uniref:Uncharacterized protein n=1 Tax=Portunus trituberculatus TaxID=210409 RepID=A0A5B7KFL0_PORTR|nr:hypothetical protein [Portunus trituberculatus]
MTRALTGERWPALQASTLPLLETTHIVLFRKFESRTDQDFNPARSCYRRSHCHHSSRIIPQITVLI